LVLNIPNCLLSNDHECPLDTEPMTKITSYLYLGNESDAKNEELLKKEGINSILNVTKNIPCYLNDINYKRISVNDSCDQNLRAYFEETYEFIEECARTNSKVLVHCQAGISRSPTIVIAYLMRKTNRKMNDIYQEVANKRNIIGPNIVFMSQLYDYEEFLQLSSTTNATLDKKKTIFLNNNSNSNNNSSNNSSCHSIQINTNPSYNNIKVCH
jgi:protein-tyrosine phosphatase